MIAADTRKLESLQGSSTDTEFARKLGISRSQYWRIKHHKGAVGAGFIEGFMRCFPELEINEYFFALDVSRENTN